VTAYTRAPEGLWETGSEVKRDDIVVIEVMSEEMDADGGVITGGSLKRPFGRIRSSSVRSLTSALNRSLLDG
jgi:hypothetical protein